MGRARQAMLIFWHCLPLTFPPNSRFYAKLCPFSSQLCLRNAQKEKLVQPNVYHVDGSKLKPHKILHFNSSARSCSLNVTQNLSRCFEHSNGWLKKRLSENRQESKRVRELQWTATKKISHRTASSMRTLQWRIQNQQEQCSNYAQRVDLYSPLSPVSELEFHA